MSGLFSTFNIVKRGMTAQQTALQVVSHNVANSNTEGYSVQRADLKATEPFGMPSLSSAGSVGQLGTGVGIASITRARDIFLDGQIRKETSTLKKFGAREEFLSQIETIFMEPSDDSGLSAMMNRFWDSWNVLSNKAEGSTARTLVAQSGDELAATIRHAYDSLTATENNNADLIQQQTFDVSTILTQIKDLNAQIKTVTIVNQTPNDLMDQRDLLLNQLSEKLSFDVDTTDFNGIKIRAKLLDSNGNVKYTDILTDATNNNGFAYVNNVSLTISGKTYDTDNYPIYIPDGSSVTNIKFDFKVNGNINEDASSNVTITDLNDLKKYFDVEEVVEAGSLKGYKINGIKPHVVLFDPSNTNYDKTSKTITAFESGSFENGSLMGFDSVSQATNNFKNQLNNLAKLLATSVNAIHSGNLTDKTASTDVKNYMINFFVSSNNEGNETAAGSISELETGIDTSGTNVQQIVEAARLIKVNKNIIANVDNVNAGKVLDSAASDFSSGNGERALLIGQLRNTRFDLSKIDNRESLVTSNKLVNEVTDPSSEYLSIDSDVEGATIGNYYKNTVTQLGILNQEAVKMVGNQETLLNQLDTRKESISGVSIDEEMTNMIQFQRSYEANAKMISVIDQLLDVVVNGLIRR